MQTLVIGLGNPILGDDGVGWRVAEAVEKLTLGCPNVTVECYALGGLSLMEHLTDSKRAIIIDSLFTGTQPIGSVSIFPLTALPNLSSGHTTAIHDTSLQNALSIGRSMDIPLPKDEDVMVVAIEAQAVYDFSEELTPPVKAAIPEAVKLVMQLLDTKKER